MLMLMFQDQLLSDTNPPLAMHKTFGDEAGLDFQCPTNGGKHWGRFTDLVENKTLQRSVDFDRDKTTHQKPYSTGSSTACSPGTTTSDIYGQTIYTTHCAGSLPQPSMDAAFAVNLLKELNVDDRSTPAIDSAHHNCNLISNELEFASEKDDTKRDLSALFDDGDMTVDLRTGIYNYVTNEDNELETDKDIHQLTQTINAVRK